MLHPSFQIKKLILLFSFFSLLINCKNLHQNQNIIIGYDNKDINEKEKKINSIYKDKFYLVFEKNFNNDLIEVLINNERTDLKKITTDNTSGEAAVFSYNFTKLNNFVIFINKNKVSLKNKDIVKYKYLFITTENNVIKLLFSNKPRYYA